MAIPKTIYRLMLKLYPARFREEYETPLERQFWDEYRELPNSRARAWFWACALADLAISIPAAGGVRIPGVCFTLPTTRQAKAHPTS